MKLQLVHLTFIIFMITIFASCVTTNYYTARTLDQGETVITPGVDNLIWITKNGEVIEKHLAFSVSLGVATGLPWRFETGIRGYFPYIYEANIRHQINPKSFEAFDISANFHCGIGINEKFREISHPYFKYGITISKEISTIQPYLSYYLSKDYIFMLENHLGATADYSILCFGAAIPFKTDLIFPECNYYMVPDGKEGFFSMGIGVRVSLDSPAIKKK